MVLNLCKTKSLEEVTSSCIFQHTPQKTGVAVTLARNESRSLEVIEKRPRKNMGSRGDIIFTLQGQELGFSEVGKDTILPIDDKYLNDGLLKILKTLRDILSVFVETNPSRISQLVSVGFLVMGKEKIKW
jgi:hypothetical protein